MPHSGRKGPLSVHKSFLSQNANECNSIMHDKTGSTPYGLRHDGRIRSQSNLSPTQKTFKGRPPRGGATTPGTPGSVPSGPMNSDRIHMDSRDTGKTMRLPILAHTLKRRAAGLHGSVLDKYKTDVNPVTGSNINTRPGEKRYETPRPGRFHKQVTELSLPYRSPLQRGSRAVYHTHDTVPTRSQGSTRDAWQADKPHNLSGYSSTIEQALREPVSKISTIVEYPQLSLNRISGCD